ncbi:MAG: hypothetical protein LBE06_12055 [Azoarcus sp.]|jgi:hypothetical protein|nr:hypothetical protein [Azoarcus sp.]
MSGFGHYERSAVELEREIVIRGIVIGLDWGESPQVRALAREALFCAPERRLAMLRNPDRKERAKGELFALSELMLDIMRQGAQAGVRVSAGKVWETFERALAAASREPRPEAGAGK